MVLVRRAASDMSSRALPLTSVATLWEGLFDDAALFPPACEQLERAVSAHLALRQSGDAAFVGAFLILGSALADLAAALPQQACGFEISIIERDASAVEVRFERIQRDDRFVVRAVEVVAASDNVFETTELLRRLLPTGVIGYAEIPIDDRLFGNVTLLADAGLRAKFRTGGTTAMAFPGKAQLGVAIAACVQADVPFKLTAGLHHAVRYREDSTGFEHHGLLNVVSAIDVACAGGVPADVTRVLAGTDPSLLAGDVRALDRDGAARVRRLLTAVGTCSIAEPLADLRALGILPAAAR